MSFITGMGTASPAYAYKQEEIGQFMSSYLQADERLQRQIGILYRKTAIKTRHSVLPDFHERNKATHLFNGKMANVSERMQLFCKEAPTLAASAVHNGFSSSTIQDVTHLITVSCTGMSAPGLELLLPEKLELPNDIVKLSVNFMGCYAAFHALKIADSICGAQSNSKVLIVAAELCSLHFTNKISDDSLRANSLFADGAAALMVEGQNHGKPALQLKGFHQDVLPQGKRDMTWEIGPDAFEMRLTSYIPDLVKDGIGQLLSKALSKLQSNTKAIDRWAIHPGGKKILDVVESTMKLNDDALDVSRDVLANYGNMSSPTVLFVLHQMWQEGLRSKDNILAAGFGPGLTLECGVFQWHDA